MSQRNSRDRKKKPNVALFYLKEALGVEQKVGENANNAGTNLNLCAILS